MITEVEVGRELDSFLILPDSSRAHNLLRFLDVLLEDFLLVFIYLKIRDRKKYTLYIFVRRKSQK